MTDHAPSSSRDVLDRVLRDTPTPTGTRRWLLERAAVGAAGVVAASAAIPAASASIDARRDSIHDIGVFTSTTEALTVTILIELLRRTSLHPEVPGEVSVIFDAVYAAELDHWNFISQHFRPSTKRFWIPDGFFGGAGDALDLTAVGKGVSAGETLFINTYLVAVTTFAEAGHAKFARYSAEAAGDESEHRVLGQTLAGASPPNNRGFELFAFESVGQIETALLGAGIGLGRQAASAGRFYDFPDSPMAPSIPIESNEPK
ncbi:MAG: hypothetical protein C5B48_05955 [Candidatus Rokuibacteriota bacterium]|nr:MAG: hypothetical protein C5B48_05955 [Candidatus Rokubacteria bacterium]